MQRYSDSTITNALATILDFACRVGTLLTVAAFLAAAIARALA